MSLDRMESRIKQDLEYLKRFTATPGKGCTRLPFTEEAKGAVDYLKEKMQEAGMETWEDEAGNVFGVLKGNSSQQPCVMMGSHYDSVTNGGDFDGIAGVVCAIEVARQIKEQKIELDRDFVVAGFCDEEGLRFGTGYFGSGAMLGHRDVEYCRKFKDMDGISIYDAMNSYGLNPENIKKAKWNDQSIMAFLELHIEQGPVLDTQQIEIGLVDCIVGIQRYMVTVHGRADHAGTTPMDMRIDAVDAATKVISKIGDWAREKGTGTVATTGYICTKPGGMNIVAEEVQFTVDIRSRNNDNICQIADSIREELEVQTQRIGGSFEIEQKLNITPVNLSQAMLDVMQSTCEEKKYTYKRMPSGAGHDSLEIGQTIPTVMIFVPSKDGRSHCPIEYTSYEEFAKATDVMVELVKKLLTEEQTIV